MSSLNVIGEVNYLYLYDLGGQLDVRSARKELKVTSGDFRRERKVPKYVSIKPEPLSYDLGTSEVSVHGIPRQMRTECRMHSVGALAILFRIEFEGKLNDLTGYSSTERLEMLRSKEPLDLRNLSRELADEIGSKLATSLSFRYEREEDAEEYAIFCVSNLQRGADALDFLQGNRKIFTAILREIDDSDRVSENECESALRYVVTYSSDYLAVVDWASSIIVQTSREYEDYLLTIELANLQLLQLRTFDKLIDRLVDKAYSDTRYLSNPPLFSMFSTRRLSATVADIAEMRMEMTDVVDRVMNITKFLGDYVLARLYEHLSARLHLREWEETVSRKLDILEDLYQMASDKVASGRMFALETLVVLLFLFEVLATLLRFSR